jgi:hypothetical protein
VDRIDVHPTQATGDGPRRADDVSNGFISVVPPSQHGGVMTMDRVERDTQGFRRPVLYKAMAPVVPELATRAFFEGLGRGDGDTVVWTQHTPGTGRWPMPFEDAKQGASSEFLACLFDAPTNVYTTIGSMAPYGTDASSDWASAAFRKVRDALVRPSWFRIDPWRTGGQAFIGYTSADFGEIAEGYPGSDWHSICTLNMFVMAAGIKRWMTCPPIPSAMPPDLVRPVSGGREWYTQAGPRRFDAVHVEPGDVLVNPPYEWHKIINARGFTCGLALRIVDVGYCHRLVEQGLPLVAREVGIDPALAAKVGEELEEAAAAERSEGFGDLHNLTSASYAARDPARAAYLAYVIEHGALTQMLLSNLPPGGNPTAASAGSTQPSSDGGGGQVAEGPRADPRRFAELYLAGCPEPLPLGGGWSLSGAAPGFVSGVLDLTLTHGDGRSFRAYVERRREGRDSFAATRFLALSHYAPPRDVRSDEMGPPLSALQKHLKAAEETLTGALLSEVFPG